VLCYAINDEKSFQSIGKWMGHVQTHAPPEVKVLLVGNKTDLEFERKVKTEEGLQMASKYNIPFFECSSKTGANVKEVFQKIAGDIYNNVLKIKSETLETQGTNVIKAKKSARDEKKCC